MTGYIGERFTARPQDGGRIVAHPGRLQARNANVNR